MASPLRYNPGYEGSMPFVRRMLDPYIVMLAAPVYAAWAEYKQRHSAYHADHDETATYKLIHRGVVKRLPLIERVEPAFRYWNPTHGSHYLRGKDTRTLVRYKKMSEYPAFRTSNVPTNIQTMLSEGSLGDLFGEGVDFLINVGYVPNALHTWFEKIVVVQWAGRPEWYAEIDFSQGIDNPVVNDVFGTIDMWWDQPSDDTGAPPNLRLKDPNSTDDEWNDDADEADEEEDGNGID